MTDIVITASDGIDVTQMSRVLCAPVWVTEDVGYLFYLPFSTDVSYRKTTNGGRTWGAPVVLGAADSDVAVGVWYEGWTPGDSGRKILVSWTGTGLDDLMFRTIDTANGDALGTLTTAFVGASAVAGIGTHISVTKARGGNIYISYTIDNGTERGLRRSVDGGANWTGRNGIIVEASVGEFGLLFPGNEADANDIWAIYFDSSANELTLKVYDDSADTVAESAVIATVNEAGSVDTTFQFPFSASIRHSDGHLVCAVVTAFDAVTAEHKVFDIGGIASITEKAEIASGVANHYHPAVFIDQDTDAIYVAYNGARDGSEDLGVATTIRYVRSGDGGDSWSDEIIFSSNAFQFRQVWVAPMGPRFAPVYKCGGNLFTSYDKSLTSFDDEPTSGAALEIQRTIYETLRADVALTELLADNEFTTGSAVYDFAPQVDASENSAKFPYVTIGEATEAEFDTDDTVGRESTITLHSWSRTRGASEIKRVMDAIKAALHDADLTVAGEHVVLSLVEFAEVLQDPDGRTLHGVQRLRIVTQGS
jgi:hypothetical protein